jgi:predicted DNA-binding transcriptional regulator YafY
MEINRLMAITNYLLHNWRTSVQKLSQEFEVSVRTITRDVDSLGQAGITEIYYNSVMRITACICQ